MLIQFSISKNIQQRCFALILTALCVGSVTAALQPPPTTAVTLFDFSGTADEPAWNAVNDGVMGGVSRGGAKLIGGSLHFRGVLS
ncbi:MAG: Complex intermediate-associated protein 30, partial [Verrucomicrobiota bacterium]